MASIEVKCPYCGSTDVIKYGKGRNGAQRYHCRNSRRGRSVFQLDYAYNGWKPGINQQIIDMAKNASGIRDTSRVLKVTTNKVLSVLKKSRKSEAG
jgi:transposase-like protein